MKLRFEVVQAEAFRRGIDVPKSIVTVEVNPSELSQEQRNLIADRLDGIDVCLLAGRQGGKPVKVRDTNRKPVRIQAKLPTFESLMEAVAENHDEAELQEKMSRGEVEVARIHSEGELAKKETNALLDNFLCKPNA